MKKKIINFIKNAASFFGAICLFIPDSTFTHKKSKITDVLIELNIIPFEYINDANAIILRFRLFVFSILSLALVSFIRTKIKRNILIKKKNYVISIEYGDILKQNDCKVVIPFDECFTTIIGTKIGDIKEKSICGQYLRLHSDLDIAKLIKENDIEKIKEKSKYKNKDKYRLGTLVPNNSDLLMAFVPLDENGKGRFDSLDQYLDVLSNMWKEIENYYENKDVCIPILGSGVTCFNDTNDGSFSQQELIEIIVNSYELSPHKIKAPNKLKIICKKKENFSLNNIDIN